MTSPSGRVPADISATNNSLELHNQPCRTKSSVAAVNAEPISGGSEALPGTLPEGEVISGGLYIAMPASAMMCE